MGRPVLTKAQLQAHRTTVPGVQDSVWSPLYDSQPYVAAGQTQLNFFANPIGTGTTSAPGATGPKTDADTNMVSSGLLAKGTEFYCEGLELLFFPGILPVREAVALANVGQFADDVWTFWRTGWLKLRIQQRDYILDAPLGKFPPTSRLQVVSATQIAPAGAATATSTVYENTYASLGGARYDIVPTYIYSNQSFGVQLNWPAAVALPSGQDARISVRLRGYLIRDAQ
jgi:hypothetical protein